MGGRWRFLLIGMRLPVQSRRQSSSTDTTNVADGVAYDRWFSTGEDMVCGCGGESGELQGGVVG